MIRRSIFAKIFLWFWASMVLVSGSVIFVTLLSGSQPLGQRWLARTLDLYAESSVDFYEHGGKPALERYLDDIEHSAGVRATLIGPNGLDVLGRGIPPQAERVYARARAAGESRFFTRLVWTGASVVHSPEGDFYFVARIYPLRAAFPQPSFRAGLLKLLIAILCAGLLSFLLARHFAGPIRTLQMAAGKFAEGDLAVRAKPLLPYREDELGELARDFDSMAQRIQALVRKQQDLLGEISHELRSPLTRMNVALELARRGETDSLERMQSELDKLEALIGQILTLTRLDARPEQNLTSRVNLSELLKGIVEDANFEGRAEGKIVSLDAPVECIVPGDASLLRSCLENVIRNAVRYTAPATSVEATLTRQNGARPFVQIAVRDHGPGVPPEALAHLFEPFYRVSEARDRATGGSGLGLSIAQRVAQMHGGTACARNLESGGLELTLTFAA